MNSRDPFIQTRVATALASVAISADAVQTGAAIDISNAVGLAFILECSAFTDGQISVQDIQFADDSSFTENLVTITSDDILMKNDRSSTVSAVLQTVLTAVGRKKISVENRAINGQKYARIRTVSADSADLTANVIALVEEKQNVVQA